MTKEELKDMTKEELKDTTPVDERTTWMATQLKMLSDSLRVVELLIKDENDDAYSHIPGYADTIKAAREHFMTTSEQLLSMGWISVLDIGSKWYEALISIAVCYNFEPSIYRKTVHEECNHAIHIWNDIVYILMN